ncbi:hypothetical protein EI94DRAFT_1702628 [Lactarius quietus]|nr:hypothetical protein EI94DRAFT_1702628 [Lactarius quietus]
MPKLIPTSFYLHPDSLFFRCCYNWISSLRIMLLSLLHTAFLVLLVCNVIFEPVQALMQRNGWAVELTVTVRLSFSMLSCGKTFKRAFLLHIPFPQDMLPTCVHIEEFDTAEHV